MATGGPDDRTQNVPEELGRVGNGVLPQKHGHTIASEATLSGGFHEVKKNRVDTNRKQ